MDLLKLFSSDDAMQSVIYVEHDGNNADVEPIAADPVSESREPEPMPHEWFNNLLEQHEELVQELLEADPAFDDDSNPAQSFESAPYECATYEEYDREFGWTREDNKKLADVIRELKKQVDDVCKVSWREITNEFNKRYDQNRTKTQLYSHFRYASRCQRMPCYLKAEEELLLAFDEMGLPAGSALPFLKTPRSEKLLELKLQKLRAAGRAAVPKDSRRANFRRRVQQILKKTWDHAAHDSKPPKRALDDIQRLIGNNSNLDKRYLTVKQAGRPKKETKMVPVTEQLKTLFQPFIYINKRRRRTTCLPGDGRAYGMNLFCVNRLLGSPLQVDKMPGDYDDAVELGVEECDVAIYAVLRELMCVCAGKSVPVEASEASNKRLCVLPPELGRLACVETQATLCDGYYYYSQGFPPADSVLPPTLYTTTGARGLLLYRDTLKAIINEDPDGKSNPEHTFSALGNDECDAKVERFLFSVLNLPLKLVQLPVGGESNSDGDSDSDDDVCYASPRLFAQRLASEQSGDSDRVVHVASEFERAGSLEIKTDDISARADAIDPDFVALMDELVSLQNMNADEIRDAQDPSVDWALEMSLPDDWGFPQDFDDFLNDGDGQVDFAGAVQNSFS